MRNASSLCHIAHNRMALSRGGTRPWWRQRALLKQRKLPAEFSGVAVTTAEYLLNRAPTKSLNGMTPNEA
jgi:hypothetical protein